jgi:hypothetical protein
MLTLVGALVAWVLAAGAAAPGSPSRQQTAAPEPPSNETCLLCHDDPAAVSSTGKPIGVVASRFDNSVHGALGVSCVTCHVDLATTQDFPHPEKLAPVSCETCHEPAVKAFESSVHAASRRQTPGSPAATCVDCHTSHEIRPSTDPESRTYPLNLPATCARCHADPQIIARGHIEIGNVAELYKDSIHGQAVSRSGLLVAANCTSCHGSHDIRPKADPQSRVHRANVPKTCGTCHEGIVTQYASGVHGGGLAAGDPRSPVCSDCHSAHQIQRAEAPGWQLDVIGECGTCHVDRIRTYRDTFHGQVTSLGFVRVATCANCHGAHAIHPKSDPRSLVSDERRVQTCQQCHANATPSFAQYDPHADKHDRERSPVLYYTYTFMTWLLGGTFAFFGVHTLLWLPRGFAERQRHRASRTPPPGPPPEAPTSEAPAAES